MKVRVLAGKSALRERNERQAWGSGASPSLPCGPREGEWILYPKWWEHLKDFKKHDPICTLEDLCGNHVEAELEVLRLAAKQTVRSNREGGRDRPDLRWPGGEVKKGKEGRKG